jgi:hypothetical protein
VPGSDWLKCRLENSYVIVCRSTASLVGVNSWHCGRADDDQRYHNVCLGQNPIRQGYTLAVTIIVNLGG